MISNLSEIFEMLELFKMPKLLILFYNYYWKSIPILKEYSELGKRWFLYITITKIIETFINSLQQFQL